MSPTGTERSLFADVLERARTAFADAGPPGWERPLATSILGPDGTPLGAHGEAAVASARQAVAAIRAKGGDWVAPGDVVLTNDAWCGSRRPTELVALSPIPAPGDGIAGWIEMRALVPDLGGWALGAYTPRALDAWAECVRLVPFRVYIGAQRRREAFGILELNSRTPALVTAIVAAMARGCLAAVAALGDGGWGQAEANARTRNDAAAAALGARLAGAARAVARGRGEVHRAGAVPAKFTVAAQIDIDAATGHLGASFPEAPPRQPRSINASASMTRDAVVAALAAVLDVTPEESGALDALVALQLPSGGALAAPEGAPVGYGHFTACRAVFDAVCDALGASLGVDTPPVPGWLQVPEHLNLETGEAHAGWSAAVRALEHELGERG